MPENRKKSKQYLIIAIAVLFVITIGFTVAYFQGQIGNGATANVNVTTKTTDTLTFNKTNDINITATQANFGSGAGNRSASTTLQATLHANNDTNSASETYNVYLNITGNSLHYTTQAGTPELLLTITNPAGNPVTSITGLTYTTVSGVSGFDITEEKGLIQIADDYTISANNSLSAVNQTWNVTVTFINLNSDQQANTNKRFTAEAIIQKEEITTAMMDTGTNILIKLNESIDDIFDYEELVYMWGQNDWLRGVGTNDISTIKRANSLPSGFVASSGNTISTQASDNPIYFWVDNTEGIMPIIPGDMNGDYDLDDADEAIMSACLAGTITCSAVQNKVGDINRDGVFDNNDLLDYADFEFDLNSSMPIFVSTSLDGISLYVEEYGDYIGYPTILNIYSDADIIYLNPDSNHLFYRFSQLFFIDDLQYFNTSFVENTSSMFEECRLIMSLEPISNWDVSSVTNMSNMFLYCESLTSLNELSNWDVSSVTDMSFMFEHVSSISSLSGLDNWNVSSVTDMSYMFDEDDNIINASAINDWNITSVIGTNFYQMFSSGSAHPTFSRVQGTWYNGTFLPNGYHPIM